ncbi:MAG: PadR family transcriptional regulator [Euryarchaeota archaeon]|nr:PadR family transcriptional regulator [Euryarchaeota archaeon]
MAQVTDAECMILGLLSCIPKGCYGYEIDKMLSGTRVRIWGHIAFSSIYHVLKRLEQKQMIACEIEYVEGKPPRKRYTISKPGEDALHENVKHSLSEVSRIYNSAEISLLFLPFLKKEEMQEALKAHLEMLQESYAECSAACAELSRYPSLDLPIMHVKLHQSLLVVRMEWVQSFLIALHGKNDEEIESGMKWMMQAVLHKYQNLS